LYLHPSGQRDAAADAVRGAGGTGNSIELEGDDDAAQTFVDLFALRRR